MATKPKPRTPATDPEIAMARALNRCTFLPGSWAKRFARDLAGEVEEKGLTVRQREVLRELVHRYRRQIPEWVVAYAHGQMSLRMVEQEEA